MSNPYHVFLPNDSNFKTLAVVRTRPSRKRKREATGEEIRKHEQIQLLDDQDRSVITLDPVAIIPRRNYPWTTIDCDHGSTRLFRANIKSLDEDHVLVATLLEQSALYVVEKVRTYTYALCKLKADTTTADVKCLEQLPLLASIRTQCWQHSGKEWWSDYAVTLSAKERSNGQRSRKAPRLSMCWPPNGHAAAQQSATTVLEQQPKSSPTDDHSIHLSPKEQYELLVAQYLDMLYKSRTSLAYFAKGPISRTRANLGSTPDDSVQSLLDFYNSMILSSTIADKKHREVIPGLIKEFPLLNASDQEVNSLKSRRKNKIKLKLDKKGFLPNETESLKCWWLDDQETSVAGEDIDQRLRRRILALRTRETFLQIILILEILSLERTEKNLPAEQNGTDSAHDEIKPKSRKSQNPSLTLEILLDKLTIWHSLNAAPITSDDKKGTSTKPASNQLADFCVEVVIPFYASRVPEVAATVNKKLGGPSAPSPVKHKSKSNRVDGVDNRKISEKRSREALHRVSSERVGSSNKGVPLLSRSATDSILLPNVKRENNETPLDKMSRKGLETQPARRSSALDKTRIRQREVDFGALSQAQEAKKKKQADVEEKLRDAISGLRKPNREVASQALAEATEQRQIIAQARAKASQLQRKRSSNNVQIDATPKHNRTKILTATPNERQYGDAHLPSSSSIVPSSSMRPPPVILGEDDVPQTGHRPHYANIEMTPTRVGGHDFVKPSLPAVRPFALAPERQAKTTAVAVPSTPSKSRTKSFEIQETPQKDRVVDFVNSTPVQKDKKSGDENVVAEGGADEWNDETNIYAALGWE